MPKYFVKDDKIHYYPVPTNCDAEYDGEKIYDYIFDAGHEIVWRDLVLGIGRDLNVIIRDADCPKCAISLRRIWAENVKQLTKDTRDRMIDSLGKIVGEEKEKPEG